MFEYENLEMRHTPKKNKNILLVYCKEKRQITISKIVSKDRNAKVIIR